MTSALLAAALPAFLASLVGFVEAFTIVLAVSVTRGWRQALVGTAAGVALLAIMVVALGPALALIPIHVLQLIVGIALVFFGMRWLRKATLRWAGFIPYHDEDGIYAKQVTALEGDATAQRFDWIGTLTSFKAVVLEGLEVVFIVIAVGATSGQLGWAAAGAIAAALVVCALAAVLHRPLSSIPENALKYGVGIMLSAFGTYWTAEGLGVEWVGADLTLIVLVAGFVVASLIARQLALARRTA